MTASAGLHSWCCINQVRWPTPLIPLLGRWRQEDQNFKGILSKFDVSLAGRDPFSKGFVVLMCF